MDVPSAMHSSEAAIPDDRLNLSCIGDGPIHLLSRGSWSYQLCMTSAADVKTLGWMGAIAHPSCIAAGRTAAITLRPFPLGGGRDSRWSIPSTMHSSVAAIT